MSSELQLLERVSHGDAAATSRLCRRLEEGLCLDTTLATLHDQTRSHYTVGITGSPGAGKSSLASRLIRCFRARGARVGVVAVDPSSPFSGGAVLGDRIRMQEHSEDPEVFVRSLATRGTLGGLAPSAEDVTRALALWGASVVLVETVGVGQAELDVMQLADTVVVVVAPGMGDDVQAAKAGILEIADVLVVNKSDKPEAARTHAELQAMLALSRVTGSSRSVGGHGARSRLALSDTSPDVYEVSLELCSAETGAGVDGVLAALDRHRAWLTGPAGQARQLERARARTSLRLRAAVLESFERSGTRLGELADSVARGERGLLDVLQSIRDRIHP